LEVSFLTGACYSLQTCQLKIQADRFTNQYTSTKKTDLGDAMATISTEGDASDRKKIAELVVSEDFLGGGFGTNTVRST